METIATLVNSTCKSDIRLTPKYKKMVFFLMIIPLNLPFNRLLENTAPQLTVQAFVKTLN